MEQELVLLNKIKEDNEYLMKNYKKIQEKFANTFVAISEGRIVAYNTGMNAVIATLKKKKLNPAFVLIEFIPPKGVEIIL